MTNLFEQRLETPMTAKRAILSALAATGDALTTSQLTQCGELLGVDGPAVRMALGRLVKKKDVIALERGLYGLGDKGQPIFEAMQRWIELPKQTKGWDGNWILVYTAHLGRVHRATLRKRERALSFLGFAAYHTGLWLRPDNLVIDSNTLHKRLIGLGLEIDATLASNASLVSIQTEELASLWDRSALESGYKSAKTAIDDVLKHKDNKPLPELARDTAVLGSAVIGMLSFDPLLPEELVNANLREQVHERMIALDLVGKQSLEAFWKRHS